MIPNFAPMAAVYQRPAATGSRDGKLFSLPVAAWNSSDAAMVVLGGVCLEAADSPRPGVQFLGMWQRGWTPAYDEMATLLPEHTPGVPPLPTVHVTIYQTASTAVRSGVWEARPTDDSFTFVDDAASLAQLRKKLSARGGFTVDAVRRLGEY